MKNAPWQASRQLLVRGLWRGVSLRLRYNHGPTKAKLTQEQSDQTCVPRPSRHRSKATKHLRFEGPFIVLSQYVCSRLVYQANIHRHQNFGDRLPDGLQKALAYIETEYPNNIRLEDVAKEAKSSTAHLFEMYKTHLKESPHQSIIKRRIRAAREMLSLSNDPIKRIALECGFSSPAAFCHCFKARTDETPAHFRRRQMGSFG